MELLALPEPIQLKILAHFNTSQLFLLSVCSKEAKEAVRRSIADGNPECFASMVATVECRGVMFVLSSTGSQCVWTCDSEPILMGFSIKYFQVTIEETVYNCGISWTPDSSTASIFLTDKDQKRNPPVYIHRYLETITPRPVAKYVKVDIAFMRYLLSAVQSLSPRALYIYGHEMSISDIDFLEQHWIDPTSCFIQPLVVGKPRNRLKMVQVCDLQIENGTWLKRNQLLWFDGATLHVKRSRLSADDIVAFVTKWMKAQSPRLEVLSLEFENGLLFDLKKITSAFRTRPFDPARRAAKYVFGERAIGGGNVPPRDASRGLDIERADTLLATFDVGPTWLFFFVWHDRFPVEEV